MCSRLMIGGVAKVIENGAVPDFLGIAERLGSLDSVEWESKVDSSGPVIEIVESHGTRRLLRVLREMQPGSTADVRFVAHSVADVTLLLSAARDGTSIGSAEVELMKARADGASPMPWCAFLESDRGMAGASVIWVTESDDERDLYLEIDGHPAPDSYFEFVAHVRQDIPALLEYLSPPS